ncbi:MAG: hypothetical protein OXG69_17675 [bacterium]|nr:hypothetical protein [bacterium]
MRKERQEMVGAGIALFVLCFGALVDIHRRSFASWVHADRRRKHWLTWSYGLAFINVLLLSMSGILPALGVFVILSCIIYLCCYAGLLIPSMRNGQSTTSDFCHPDH